MGFMYEELDFRPTSIGDLMLRRRRMPQFGDRDIYEVKLGEDFLMTSLFHEAEAQLAEGQKSVDPASLNFKWGRKGNAGIQPIQLYDDGTSTYLTWSRDATLPAILVRDEKGHEGPVNYAVRGDVIVIDGVPATIYLRAGRQTAQLDYRGPVRSTPQPTAPALAAATTKEP